MICEKKAKVKFSVKFYEKIKIYKNKKAAQEISGSLYSNVVPSMLRVPQHPNVSVIEALEITRFEYLSVRTYFFKL
jgi:hypothetical protein